MIEQALHLLTLHIIWKGKGLVVDPEPSPEELRFRETLKEQRESLLEKLVEYAVGTQSNTVEGVKRAVRITCLWDSYPYLFLFTPQAFKNLLDLHVLFSSSQTVAADGSPLSTASVPLILDDEVQYRCAGFIQAEIERYAEALDDGGDDDDDDKGSDEEESSDDDKATETTKRKKSKGGNKKPEKESMSFNLNLQIVGSSLNILLVPRQVVPTSRARLEQEYVFIDVMSTFLRAIRAGAIHVRHGAILLAHYGRLGPAFDVCSKVVVEVLREEGMIHNKGDVVVMVLTQAIQEVRRAFSVPAVLLPD